MITLDAVEEMATQLTDSKQKAIFKVLIASYKHWLKEQKLNHSWPYDEHVNDMVWDCEVAILAFMSK